MLSSGSRVELAMTCALSATLPQTDRITEPALNGHHMHAFMVNAGQMALDAAVALAPEHLRDFCESIDISTLPVGAGWEAEPAYAYDVVTEKVRFLGHNIERRYGPTTPSEICLSLDSVGQADDTALVVDWKTGRGRVTAAKDNWQLRLGALVVAKHRGLSQAKVAIVRLREDRAPYFDVAEFDEFDLGAFAADLRELYARTQAPEKLRPVTGDHCKYCPAFEACPAQGQLLVRATSDTQALEKELFSLLTMETAAKAWDRVKAVENVIGRVKSAIYQFAATTPLELGNGRMLGQIETTKEVLDARVTRGVMLEKYGAEIADVACDFDTSKAAIRRALQAFRDQREAAGEDVKVAPLNRAVLAAIAERGGVTTRTRLEVREYNAALPEGVET